MLATLVGEKNNSLTSGSQYKIVEFTVKILSSFCNNFHFQIFKLN